MGRGKWLLLTCVLMTITPGCATPDKPLALKETQSITSLKAVRFESIGLCKKTAGSQMVGLTGVMFGAVGGAIGGGISYSMESSGGKALVDRCALPDFNQLVFAGFVQRFENDFPDWPKPVVEENPIKDYTMLDHSGFNLVLRVTALQVDHSGLMTVTIARMFDPRRQVVWEKGYTYKSSDSPRRCSLNELEADNGKLLREEVTLAAEKTVSDLINHLKGSPSVQLSGKQ